MFDVITFGEPLLLFSPEAPGPLRHIDGFRKSIGGAELNFAIAAARLGGAVGWFGKVGADEFGEAIVAALRAEGVDTSRVLQDPSAPTGIMFKERRGLGDPRVIYYRHGSAAAQFAPADLAPEYLAQARYLHVTGITAAISASSRAAVQEAIATAKGRGVKISFDPNIRRKLMPAETLHDLLLPLISSADVLTLGLDEGQQLFGVQEPEAVGEAAHAAGPSVVAVKMGANGCLVSNKQEQFYVPAVKVAQVVDTVGAGDGFAAGFLLGLCQGMSLGQAAQLGAAVGAAAVTVWGDYEGYPTWAEATAMLGWSQGLPLR